MSLSELSCRSILVVDDDPDVRDAVADVLADEGYGVTGVGSGREALQHLQQHMRPSLILLDMMMPEMDGWLLRQELKKSPDLASIPDRDPVRARRRARRRPGAGRRRLPAQAAQHREPARDRRALLPPGVPQLSRNPALECATCRCGRRWAVRARGGCWRPPVPRAPTSTSTRRRGRARAAAAAAALGALADARDAALRAALLSGGARVRGARGARRRARLPPDHALPQLGAERARQPAAHRSDRRRERPRQLRPLQLHLRLRRAARRDGRALRLRRLRQAADHARVHPRRAPRHDPELVPAPDRLAPGQDLRAQPVAADLLHRRARGADGVAAHDRGPAAQQLLRHAPARAVSRGARARPRRRVGRLRPARLSGRQRPLPLRLQHPPLHRGSLRAREGARDLAPLRRTSASPAASTASRGRRSAAPTPARSATTSGTTGAVRRRTATRCRRRRPSGAA